MLRLSIESIMADNEAPESDMKGHLRFLRALIVAKKAQVVVELGTRFGQSTVALLCGVAETGGHVYSCDIDGCVEARRRVAAYKLADYWTFTEADSICWGKVWWPSGTFLFAPIDVLFVDTSHRLEQTRGEIAAFAPKVKSGGFMLFHDTESTTKEWRDGVNFAIGEFLDAHPTGYTYYNLKHCFGLGVMEVLWE